VVVDGDPATTWFAAGTDQHPWLRLTWPTARRVTGLRMTLDLAVAAARPWAITVMGDGGVRGGVVGDDGTVTFDQPLRTDELTVIFADVARASSYNPYENEFEQLPVGVGELTALPAQPTLPPDPDEIVTLPCGSGPTLDLAGTRRTTAVTATRRDLAELRDVRATPCQPAGGAAGAGAQVDLPSGQITLVATGSALFTPVRLALDARRSAQAAVPSPVRVVEWSPAQRRLRVGAGAADRVLALRENANAGWRATAGGRVLRPLVVDGWQQGWLLPAGAPAEVTLTFTPDRAYRAGLAGGLIALLVLFAAAVPRRRGAARDGANSAGQAVRDDVRRPGPARRLGRPFLATAVGGAAMVSLGGLATIGVALVGLGATLAYRTLLANLDRIDQRQIRRAQRTMWRWLPVLLFAAAGAWSLLADERRSAVGPQLLALAVAGALWLSIAVRAVRRRGHRAPAR
jgi:arabinofuranan 3-O-arabinosyltransferase